jgi:hypothetical protein
VTAVRRALVVGVVLVEHDVRLARVAGETARVERDLLPRLVPQHDITWVGALRRGVLRVGMVDVQPGAVGEDHVGQAQVLVGEQAGVRGLARHVEASGVAKRRLLLEVPARTTGPQRGARIGVHHPGARDHRVGHRLPDHGDAELRLGPHHPAHTHVRERTRAHTGTISVGPTARQRLTPTTSPSILLILGIGMDQTAAGNPGQVAISPLGWCVAGSPCAANSRLGG